MYVLIHNDPVRYHHLYMYLANRSATSKELAKVTNYLYGWEKELHHMNKLEVIKCWRLHLGSSALTGMIINSVADKQSLASRCTNTFYPFRQFIRSCRRRLLKSNQKKIPRSTTMLPLLILPYCHSWKPPSSTLKKSRT